MKYLLSRRYALYGMATFAVGATVVWSFKTWADSLRVDPPAEICSCENRLRGKKVVITGATSGIGKELAFQCAKMGAHVIIGCRDTAKGREVSEEIISKTQAKVDVYSCDFSRLQSCRDFAEQIRFIYGTVNFLVNNVGIFNHPCELTMDDFEKTWQTNFLGHVVVTENLKEAFEKEENPGKKAVIFTGSAALNLVNINRLLAILPQSYKDVADITKFEDAITHYAYTKLALWYYAMFIAIHFPQEDALSELEVFYVDPGTAWTNIYNHTWKYDIFKKLKNRIGMRTPFEACQTIIHCMNKPQNIKEIGELLKDCKVQQKVGTQDKIDSVSFISKVYPFIARYVDRLATPPSSASSISGAFAVGSSDSTSAPSTGTSVSSTGTSVSR